MMSGRSSQNPLKLFGHGDSVTGSPCLLGVSGSCYHTDWRLLNFFVSWVSMAHSREGLFHAALDAC